MPNYIIAYDLNKEKDYNLIINELKKYDCQKVQKSLWFGSFDDPVKNVFEYFSNFVDADDNLLVSEFFKSKTARKMSLKGTKDWLDKN